MTIRFQCPQCGAAVNAPVEMAGKRAKCATCKKVLQVPHPAAGAKRQSPSAKRQAPAATSQPEAKRPPVAASSISKSAKSAPSQPASVKSPVVDPELARDQALGGFQGAFQPVEIGENYQGALLLVAVLMVLLPLAYFGMMVLFGSLLVWHGLNHTSWMMSGQVPNFWGAVAYFGVLLVGLLTFPFLLKPFVARPAAEGRRRSVTPKSQPLLFEFVERLCQTIGAPIPKRIDVTCDVNASASFRRGAWSVILGGDDLVLTIGVPLASALTMPQFAGVLAHELGHFSQRAGMKMSFLIRAISWWLTRVVYERDQFDQWLMRPGGSVAELQIISWTVRALVWVSRALVWCLMMIGHAMSGFLLRQMEYEADLFEGRIAGATTFAHTVKRLTVLNFAHQGAMEDLRRFYQEERLADNLPRLIVANISQIPPKIIAGIDSAIAQSTASWLDTHPSDSERIVNVRQDGSPGIFHVDLPASALFQNFDELCRNVTWDFYRHIFGPKFKISDMHSTDELLAVQQQEEGAGEALERFFLGRASLLRVLPVQSGYIQRPSDPQKTGARLRQARQQMLAGKDDYQKALDAFIEADGNVVAAGQALALHRAGMKAPQAEYSVPVGSREEARNSRRRSEINARHLSERLAPFESLVAERMMAALELLHLSKVSARMEDGEQCLADCTTILPALNVFTTNMASMMELRDKFCSLAALCGHIAGNENNSLLITSILEQSRHTQIVLRRLRDALALVTYPFDHARKGLSLADYLISQIPIEAEDVGGMCRAADELLDRAPRLYFRLAGRAAEMAEKVEAAVGLPPLG